MNNYSGTFSRLKIESQNGKAQRTTFLSKQKHYIIKSWMNVMQFLVEWNKNGQWSLCFIVLNEFCNFINMCHILSCWAYFLQNISSYFYANSKYFETYYSRFNQICSLLNAKFDITIIMKIQRYERMVASLLVSVVEEIELNSFSIEFYLHLSQVNKKFSPSLSLLHNAFKTSKVRKLIVLHWLQWIFCIWF